MRMRTNSKPAAWPMLLSPLWPPCRRRRGCAGRRRQVELVVDDDCVGMSVPVHCSAWVTGLAAEVHEGLRLNQRDFAAGEFADADVHEAAGCLGLCLRASRVVMTQKPTLWRLRACCSPGCRGRRRATPRQSGGRTRGTCGTRRPPRERGYLPRGVRGEGEARGARPEPVECGNGTEGNDLCCQGSGGDDHAEPAAQAERLDGADAHGVPLVHPAG